MKNISAEIDQRLRFDQVVARKVLLFLATVYKKKSAEIAEKLAVTEQTIQDWFLERSEISREDCWKIFELSEKEIVPLEWMIRGEDVLNEYDPDLIVILAREFVRVATARFAEEASPDETHEEFLARTQAKEGTTEKAKVKTRLCLVVPSSTLTVLEISSWPGRRKLGLGISPLRNEELQTYIYSIDEDEAQIGGMISISLPLIPEALNKSTLTTYDRHADHSFNFRDYLELIRIIRDGVVVSNSYFRDCYKRAIEKQFPNLRKSRKRTPRTV